MSATEGSKTPYCDIKTLSAYLQIKVSTLYAWSAQNKIPSIKIHGVIRFRKEEIDTWLEGFLRKKSKTVPMNFKERKCDIDSLIARAKREVYNGSHRETRPKSAQRKEKERTIDEMMERYMAEHGNKLASRSHYQGYIKNLLPFFGGRTLAEITPNLVVRYKAKRYEHGVKPATINRELAVMKNAFNLAIREWCRYNPVSKVAMEGIVNLK